jgi:hypothetical protein
MNPLVRWIRSLSRPVRPIRSGARAIPRPLFVEPLEDRVLPTIYTVTTASDLLHDTTPGEVTLRDVFTAISTQLPSGNAAAGTGNNTVNFAIGAPGSAQTINVGSGNVAAELPTVTHQMFLDGLSQGGTNYAGPPLIVLNGTSAGTNGTGLILVAGSDGSTIRGLVIQQFLGDAIQLNQTSSNRIAGNYLGTDLSGTVGRGNAGAGLFLVGGAKNNTVGGTTSGEANLISGNNLFGMVISQTGTSGNQILGNLIGTDVTGKVGLGNGNVGVYILGGATGNTVGGANPGTGNVISGNGYGVVCYQAGTSGNSVLGNLIGTDVNGTAVLANSQDGVFIGGGSSRNTVGGTAAANVISGNGIDGVLVSGKGTSGNLILGNLIGTDANGGAALGNDSYGVLIGLAATRNTVGGTAVAAGNIISANATGLSIQDPGTTGNIVLGNRIGTDRTGTSPLGNKSAGLFLISGATDNTVGGTATGAGNVISANATDGVDDVAANRNVFLGNYIGTDASGTAGLGNGANGLSLASTTRNTVGGTVAGSANVISANARNGVVITNGGTSGNVVLGNLIGTDRTGAIGLGNGNFGIAIGSAATANTVGGLAAGAANTISANLVGVGISSRGTSGNLVLGNLIGTDRTGTARIGNTLDGVSVDSGATANTIGGAVAGSANVISANGFVGVLLGGVGTTRNVVLGNLIGTDETGTVGLGNLYAGVLIQGATGNTIGGKAAGAANVISANLSNHFGSGGYGVQISAVGTSGNLVLGNLIGTDKAGQPVLGNAVTGVVISNGASANTVGGQAAGAANLISGNRICVDIEDPETNKNVVLGNLIGTDKTGTSVGVNKSNEGVQIGSGATSNTIGGTTPGSANVIAGCLTGVEISDPGTSRNVVQGNLIGTDKSGTIALGNDSAGVFILFGATDNTVGGTARGAANVIAANGDYGVEIAQGGGPWPTSGNVVQGNFIGTDKSSTANLGNGNDGVRIESGASRNTIADNTIAFNVKGVVVIDAASTGDSILRNSIFGNFDMGIDLADDEPTPNDGNPRAYPNNGQNTPVITALTLTSVSGTLSSIANTRFRLEFFASPSSLLARNGKTFLGSLIVTTRADGTVSFTATVSAIPAGDVVTATATNLTTGDTSEFSPVGTQLLVRSNPVISTGNAAQVVVLMAQVSSGNFPISSGTVTFKVAGLSGLVTGTVDAFGFVTVAITVPARTSPGLYTITARFSGTDEADPATADGFLTSLIPNGRRSGPLF